MVSYNCWECGQRMSNCDKTFWDKRQDKIFCKKCRKKYQRGEIPKGKSFSQVIKEEINSTTQGASHSLNKDLEDVQK